MVWDPLKRTEVCWHCHSAEHRSVDCPKVLLVRRRALESFLGSAVIDSDVGDATEADSVPRSSGRDL